ncbi:MAG: VTT domain-containing protein [Hyphomonadaceae bacterium]
MSGNPAPQIDPSPSDEMPAGQGGAQRLLVPLGLLALIALGLIASRAGWLGDLDQINQWAETLDRGPLGLLALTALFCVGAFLAVPQFVLIGAAVIGFGPMLGFAYAWIATLGSGTLTYWTGRSLGADILKRYAGKRLDRLTRLISENAFTASAIIRTVPTGPFLFVNMVFGASGARFMPFLLGLAGGSLPKLALIAFAGESLVAALTGSIWRAIGVGAVTILIWLIIGWASKRALSRSR